MEFITRSIVLMAFCTIGVHCGLRQSFSLVPLQFKHHGISPEYVDPAPKTMCQVVFPSGASANLGNRYPAAAIADQPRISWPCDPDEKYTVIVADLDPVGQDTPLGSECRIWLVVNITSCNWNISETVYDWLKPSPLRNTGAHRYVVLVYEQPAGLYYEEVFEPAK